MTQTRRRTNAMFGGKRRSYGRRWARRKRTHLPKEFFLVPRKHTRAVALNTTMEACFAAGLDLVDEEAPGRPSLRCSREVADALRKGIHVGGRLVRAESEDPSDDDQSPQTEGRQSRSQRSRRRQRQRQRLWSRPPMLWVCVNPPMVPMQADEVRGPEGPLRQMWRARASAGTV